MNPAHHPVPPLPFEPPVALPSAPRHDTVRIHLPPLSHPRPWPAPTPVHQQGAQQQ